MNTMHSVRTGCHRVPATMGTTSACIPVGVGNFGTVHKVRHKVTHKDMARKVVRKHLSEKENEQILRELMVLCSSDSPFVVKFFGYNEDEYDNFFIFMEYMDAGSLDAIRKLVGRVPERQLKYIALAILEGLFKTVSFSCHYEKNF